ncbi:MAG: DUF799 family lipoprotein [Elusimicrobia bacterium]|nr:DUF799 family lipoprotein [Elusimicrobiota bacterium]
MRYFILFCLLIGCAPRPAIETQSLWTYSSNSSTRDFHFVLIWNGKKSEKSYSLEPELLVKALGRECRRRREGAMRSYQIVGSEDELIQWAPYWKPETPVLVADASLNVERSTSVWKADLKVDTRFQAFLFDDRPIKEPLRCVIAKDVNPADLKDDKGLSAWGEWIDQTIPVLYQQFISKFFSQADPFRKEFTDLLYYTGKTQGMKDAYQAAKSKDWSKAKQLWLKELEINRGDPVLNYNLSVAAQMLGEWDEAYAYDQKYLLNKNPGLAGIFSGMPMDKERIVMLQGLSSTFKNSKSKTVFNPDSKVAILPLENYTNDIRVPSAVREQLTLEASRLGFHVVPYDKVEELLRMQGFTDGGQLSATTPKELGKIVGAELLVMGVVEALRKSSLKLVHAPSGNTIFQKKVYGFVDPMSWELAKQPVKIRLVAPDEFFYSWPRKYD